MKLKTVQVRNFRCVEDSGPFNVVDVTALVGKNESGKTTLLAALEKLNAAFKKRGDFTQLDFPRRKWRPDQALPLDPPAIHTTWELTKEDLAALEDKLGPGIMKSHTVTVSKAYDNKLVVTGDVDEAAAVKALIAAAALTAQDQAKLNFNGSTLSDLRDAIKAVAEPSEGITALQAAIGKRFKNGIATVHEAISGLVPTFVYFGEYNKLDGTVSLDALIQRKANGQLTAGDQIFDALMHLAGTTPEDVNKQGTFEQLNATLRAVSNQISEQIFEYWTQNKHLEAVLRFDAGRTGDQAPFNQGWVFRTRIDNHRHKSDTSFDERSSGFVWFFSFLVWFSQLKKRYGSRLVILLDEPGLTLHARAQADLLRYFNEKLKPEFQVLYTTHSPFMIDPDNLLSARTVEDVTKDEKVLGTKVGERVLSTDPDTVSPLQKALDYEMTQTLFVGRHTLLVEGPADLGYMKWFSNQLRVANRVSLDYRWTICIVGGVDRIPGFASLFRGNRLQIAAVVDTQKNSKQRLEKAKAAVGENRVFPLDKYVQQPEADIEDLLGREFYAAVLNGAYRLSGADVFKPDLAARTRALIDAETHFKTLPMQYAEFNHYAPAAWLFENTAAASKLPGYATAMDGMEKLFKDLNAAL
jgi:predicted ATPase